MQQQKFKGNIKLQINTSNKYTSFKFGRIVNFSPKKSKYLKFSRKFHY